MPLNANPHASYLVFTGTGVNAADVLFTTPDVARFNIFEIMTTAGNVDILVSIDDVNFSTVPMALEDQGATTPTTYVTATAATGRLYRFTGKYARIRMRQSGATAATGFLRCGCA